MKETVTGKRTSPEIVRRAMSAEDLKSDPEFIGLVAEMKQDVMTLRSTRNPTSQDPRRSVLRASCCGTLLARIDCAAHDIAGQGGSERT